jgi:biotin synthase
VSEAKIDKYPLMAKETLLDGARRAREAGAKRYCMVTSGRGPTDEDIEHFCEVARAIREAFPLEICVSLGLMSEAQACKLKEAGVGWVNHNLNTSERYYPEICTTHTYQDRVETVRNVRKAGLLTCSGGIVGMGETDEDILDLAFAVRELGMDSIPVNFLHPVKGTPMEAFRFLTPMKCLKVLCLFRLLNPASEIRAAGGREVNLRSVQPLVLYAANSIFVEGYLTTPGQEAAEAHRMIEEMGFEVEEV